MQTKANAKKIRVVDPEFYSKPIQIQVGKEYEGDLAKVGKEIVSLIDQQYLEREARDAIIDDSRRQYGESIGFSNGKGPWEGSANVHTPITRNDVDVLHAEILRVCTGTEPYARFRARQSEMQDTARKWEDLVQSQLVNEVHYRKKLDGTIKRCLTDGVCIGYACYRKEYRMERDRLPLSEDLLQKLGMGDKIDDAKRSGVSLVAGSDPVRIGQADVEVEHETLTANHPDFIRVDAHDFVAYPTTGETIDDKILCGHGFYMTANDMMRGIHEGRYDAAAVNRVLDEASPMDFVANGRNPSEPQGTNGYMEESTELGSTQIEKHIPYRFFQVIYEFDADGDGCAEDCLFTIEYTTGIPLQALPNPYWHGKRPYVKYEPFPREGYFWGYTLPEILKGLQEQANTVINQILDAGNLALSPFITKVRTSSTDFASSRFTLGRIWDVDDPKDITVHNIPVPTQDGFLDFQLINAMAEKVSGVTDATAGLTPDKSRPLGETTALLERAGYRFQVIIDRIQDANAEYLKMHVSNNRQYLDADTEFMLTGENAGLFESISKDELRTAVSIYPLGNNSNTSREMEMVSAEKIVMRSATSPALQLYIEGQWEVDKKFLESHGIIDVETYIGKKADFVQQMQQKMQQGIQVPPPAISGKIDETTALLLLAAEDPSLIQKYLALSKIMSGMGLGADGKQQADAYANQKQQEISSKQSMAEQQISFKEQMAKAKISQHASQQAQNTKMQEQMASQNVAHQSDMANQQLTAQNQIAQQELAHRDHMGQQQIATQSDAAGQQIKNQQAMSQEKLRSAKANARNSSAKRGTRKTTRRS